MPHKHTPPSPSFSHSQSLICCSSHPPSSFPTQLSHFYISLSTLSLPYPLPLFSPSPSSSFWGTTNFQCFLYFPRSRLNLHSIAVVRWVAVTIWFEMTGHRLPMNSLGTYGLMATKLGISTRSHGQWAYGWSFTFPYIFKDHHQVKNANILTCSNTGYGSWGVVGEGGINSGRQKNIVGMYLRKPVFSHGQLYGFVVLSRVRNPANVRLLSRPCSWSVKDKLLNKMLEHLEYLSKNLVGNSQAPPSFLTANNWFHINNLTVFIVLLLWWCLI